jgi:hypothetical protein
MICALVFSLLAAPAVASAQTYGPWVTMTVTTPDGETLQRTARDSSVASVTLKNGTTYELRPTIHDYPYSKVTIGIFKAATATELTTMVGEVDVTKGSAAVESKTQPKFKIAITRIDALGSAPSS